MSDILIDTKAQIQSMQTQIKIHAECGLAMQADISRLFNLLNQLSRQFYAHLRDHNSNVEKVE